MGSRYGLLLADNLISDFYPTVSYKLASRYIFTVAIDRDQSSSRLYRKVRLGTPPAMITKGLADQNAKVRPTATSPTSTFGTKPNRFPLLVLRVHGVYVKESQILSDVFSTMLMGKIRRPRTHSLNLRSFGNRNLWPISCGLFFHR